MRWYFLCACVLVGCGEGEIVIQQPSDNLRKSSPGAGPALIGQTNDDRKTDGNLVPITKSPDDLPNEDPTCIKGYRQIALGPMKDQAGQCLFPAGAVTATPDTLELRVGGQLVPRDGGHQTGWDHLAPFPMVGLYGAWCTSMASTTPADRDIVLIEPCTGRLEVK